MSIRKALVYILIWTPFKLLAFEGMDRVGARSASLGGIAMIKNDVWNSIAFPALLPFHTQKRSVGLSVDNRFGVEQLNRGALGFNWVKGKTGMGVSVQSFGNAEFALTQYALGLGSHIAAGFSLGFTLSYARFYAANYGLFAYPSLLLAVCIPLQHEMNMGVTFRNPFGLHAQAKERGLPSEAAASFSFSKKTSAAVQVLAEGVVSERMGTDLRLGIEYQINPRTQFRSGCALRNQSMSLGFTFGHAFPVLLSLSFHNRLGVSPGLDFWHVYGKQ